MVLVEADCVVVVVLVRESVEVAVVVEVLESVEVAVAWKKEENFSIMWKKGLSAQKAY